MKNEIFIDSMEPKHFINNYVYRHMNQNIELKSGMFVETCKQWKTVQNNDRKIVFQELEDKQIVKTKEHLTNNKKGNRLYLPRNSKEDNH